MTKRIIAQFSPDGTMQAETTGFSGDACLQTMGKLAQWAKKFGLTVNAKDIVRTQDAEVAENTTETVKA